jgi:4-hydroxy-tetrahydrodipicolinate synthase
MALDGLVVPTPTLFGDSGALDTGRNAKFARTLSDAKVDHLFVLGSTGEFPSVTDPERSRLVDIVVESATGKTDVWVGCGAPSTGRAVAYAEEAEAAGASAVVAVPPYYLRPTLDAVQRYYRAIRAAVTVPVLAYDNPSLVGYALPPSLLHGLAREGVLDGVKETSETLESVVALLEGAPDRFAVFPGDDRFAVGAIARGAKGAVMGVANVVPRLCVELVGAAGRGDLARARELQALVDALVEVRRAGPFPSTIKYLAAELRGADVGYRAPYDALSPEEAARVNDRLTALRERLAPFLGR